jgi:hypothetical protein
MRITVRRNVVAATGDGANQLRMPLRHPSQHETGRANVGLVEHVQQPLRIALDAALHAGPLRARNDAVEDTDVKVIFHIDRHRVDDRRVGAGNHQFITWPSTRRPCGG